MEVGLSASHPSYFIPGERAPGTTLDRKLGGPQRQSDQSEK